MVHNHDEKIKQQFHKKKSQFEELESDWVIWKKTKIIKIKEMHWIYFTIQMNNEARRNLIDLILGGLSTIF